MSVYGGLQLQHKINYAELKDAYIRANAGVTICKRQRNISQANVLIEGWARKSSFYGPSAKDVIGWLHNGYKQPGLTLDPPIDPLRKRRRLVYGEEGELQLDLAWSGHDYPFLSWTTRETMPGMKVDIMFNFQAGTNVQIIIDYCRFILRSLIALENAGIDLEIWITSQSDNIFTSGNHNDALYNKVQVKKEGENTDYLGWSAMLSPGGFRHLMFLDYVIAADELKRNVSGGLGHGTNGSQPWKIEFDTEDRELFFKCPYHPYSFPEEDMELQLKDVLLNARRET